MRVTEGEFTYDIQPVRDPSTMLFRHFRVVLTRTQEIGTKPLYEGAAKTLEEAQEMAESEMRKLSLKKAS